MSISSMVDANYRLTATDLAGAPRRVHIANVTYQGVESMTPVLHFTGQAKRLVLTPQQTGQMIEIGGSAHFGDWIGKSIVLQPRQQEGQQQGQQESQWVIALVHPDQARRATTIPREQSEDRKGWRMSLLVVCGLLAISSSYLLLNYATLVAIAQELLANPPFDPTFTLPR